MHTFALDSSVLLHVVCHISSRDPATKNVSMTPAGFHAGYSKQRFGHHTASNRSQESKDSVP
jgi:hypothetical protein